MRKVAEILDRIECRKERLLEAPLFVWLSDRDIPGDERLRFAPSMLYYLMGFKDVLGALHRAAPEDRDDLAINAYCGEDAEHWRWYLTDLETLGFGLETWGRNIASWCDEVWGPATQVNRSTTFALVEQARAAKTAIHALALIWVFEATGIVFIGHTRKAAIAMGMDDRLHYFGRAHYEEEFSHSVTAATYASVERPDDEVAEIVAMVDELFDRYENLFRCWYDHRRAFAPANAHVLA